MATKHKIDERRRVVKGFLDYFTKPCDIVRMVTTQYEVSDRTVKNDIKVVRATWFEYTDDFAFDIQREYELLGEMLGMAKKNGEPSLAANLSQQRARLRKEKQQYALLQSSGLEDPGVSTTLAAALSDLNGSATPE